MSYAETQWCDDGKREREGVAADLGEPQSRLWEAADQLRADSGLKAPEHASPVLIYEHFLGDFAFSEGQKGGKPAGRGAALPSGAGEAGSVDDAAHAHAGPGPGPERRARTAAGDRGRSA